MDDLLCEFITESSENLANLDNELVSLEQDPNNEEILRNIFRIVHTLKGTCGFLGLSRLESVAHSAENVLGKMRDGDIIASAGEISLILETLDLIKGILADIEANETEPEGDDSDLIARLNAVADGASASPTASDGHGGVSVEEQESAMCSMAQEPEGDFAPDVIMEEAGNDFDEMAQPSCDEGPEPIAAKSCDSDALDDVEELQFIDPPPAPESRATTKKEAEKQPKAVEAKAAVDADDKKESHLAQQTIRVNVELLENLMTMVSELVLTRNQLLQMVRQTSESAFTAPLEHLSHITSELQESVMKTRMQPIGTAWSKLPRVIRDLATELGKKIELQMLGAETELDRQVIEMIKDPLTHMVRNSVDHGIEMPQERVGAGKSDTGHILLNAYHEGGHIVIEISDDGKGLNGEKIRAKAIANNLATEAELASMSDNQIYQFIFKAGFSTAAQVTNISGRGVGMDVVRTNIEKIGGTIELKAIEGRGTVFTIKIPLTLAIVSAMIVDCGEERFAIPQISVVELVRASTRSEHKLEHLDDALVLRLRDHLLPIIPLAQVMKLKGASQEISLDQDHYIIVMKVGGQTFGVLVDRVFDTQEIVVKPVAPIIRHLSIYSGNTILGDGSVVMILDPNGIATMVAEKSSGSILNQQVVGESHLATSDKTTLLLFKSDDAIKAVPLALVSRIEEVKSEDLEHAEGRTVLQYRGYLMPLISLDPHRPLEFNANGKTPVLVFSNQNHAVGLVVNEIVDIAEETIDVKFRSEQVGSLGSLVIHGKTTDIIDADYYLRHVFPDWFHAQEKASANGAAVVHSKVLLVDDCPFFRNLLAPVLQSAGYEVTTVESGSRALNLCDDGYDFDIIISDIEMPEMDGYAFLKKVRENSRWSDVPVLALSAHTDPKVLKQGKQAGFNDFVGKHDRENLLTSLDQTIQMAKGAA